MKIEVSEPASNEAINIVMSNLWQRGLEELELVNVSRQSAAMQIAAWRDQGYPSMGWSVDGLPVFICGLVPDGKLASTWFQATDDFTQHQREITRALKRKIEDEAARLALDEVEIFSACIHPRTGRWFAALGFELDIDRHPAQGQPRFYRFVRKMKRESHVLLEAEPS